MMTHDELISIYEGLHKKGYGRAEMDTIRAKKIQDYVNDVLCGRGSVFDASCGRGVLLKMLKADGYEVRGSEASRWLIDNVLHLIPLPVRDLRYSELDQLKSDAYDVVISNDVLEHLLDEDEVVSAMTELCRASRRYVLVSVGLNHATRKVGGRTVSLHNVVEPGKWWADVYSRFCRIHPEFKLRNSYFIFGEKLIK